MAQSKPLKQQFTDDDLIQCGICHVDIEHPRSLTCLHTYCLACLREWSKKGSRKDEIICPLCREATPLPSNGVDGLRSNFLITKLKERKAVLSQLMDKDVKIVCTACDVIDCNEAVTRCLECDDFLCSPCTKAHKIVRMTKKHSILSLVELRSGEVSLIKYDKDEHCLEHSGQVLWFYCKTCGVPICRDCTVVEHPSSSHELVKLGTAIGGQREEIQKLIEACKAVKENVHEALQEVTKKRHDLQSRCSKVGEAIDARKEEAKKSMNAFLDIEAERLKKTVAGMMSAREKYAGAYEDELQLLNARLTTALEMGNKLSTDGSDCDVASAYRPLITTLKQLEKVDVASVNLGDVTFVKRTLQPTAAAIGRINGRKMTTFVRRKPSTKLDKGGWNSQWKVLKDFGNTGDSLLKAARAVSVNANGSVAVVDTYSSHVNVYNIDDGKCEMTIDTKNALDTYSAVLPSHPYGIAEHGGLFAVTCQFIGKIVLCKSDDGKLVRQLKRPDDQYRTLFGIAITSKGQAFVGYGGQSLGIYDIAGGKMESFLDKLPAVAEYIAVSSDNSKVVISDHFNGSHVIDPTGQIIHASLQPPKDITPLWYPSGVCTTGEEKDEEIFICNDGTPKGMYRFSLTTGEYLGCVTTDVKYPRGIAFTDDVKLVVADETCIKVFAPHDEMVNSKSTT